MKTRKQQFKNYIDVIQEAVFVCQGNGAKRKWWKTANKHYRHHTDDSPLDILNEAKQELQDQLKNL